MLNDSEVGLATLGLVFGLCAAATNLRLRLWTAIHNPSAHPVDGKGTFSPAVVGTIARPSGPLIPSRVKRHRRILSRGRQSFIPWEGDR